MLLPTPEYPPPAPKDPMTDVNNSNTPHFDQTFSQFDYATREFTDQEFDNCLFDGCDFSEAHFYHCSFTDCTFTHCNLNLLQVAHSKFTDVKFMDCKALGIDWTKAYWRGLNLGAPLWFQRCLINSSSFYGLQQTNMVIESCRAHDVDFREADLSGANFSDSDLTHSLFGNTNLTDTNFQNASNYDINLNNNILKNAQFSRYEAVRLLEYLGLRLVD